MTTAETTDLVKVKLPGVVNEFQARDVLWQTRGYLMAVVTPSSVHLGHLSTIIMHGSGRLSFTLEKDGYKTEVTVNSDHPILISNIAVEVPDGTH